MTIPEVQFLTGDKRKGKAMKTLREHIEEEKRSSP